MPFDFMIEEDSAAPHLDNGISAVDFEVELKEKGIDYTTEIIELLGVEGTYEKDVFPWILDMSEGIYNAFFVNANQLQKAGLEVETPTDGSVIFHSASMGPIAKDIKIPFEMYIISGETESVFTAVNLGEGNVVNGSYGPQLVVSDADFEKYRKSMKSEIGVRNIQVFNITDKDQLVIASDIKNQNRDAESESYRTDYYSAYEVSIQENGLLIFITGFLGLVFLISTGSVLYFKQMTEAEQEKQSYATLRQLGFTVKDIMRGILRKQALVFGLPLLIGLLHSVFAIKAASFIFMSDITVPASIVMGMYALIYLMFAFLTVGYYRNIVKTVL